VNTAGWYSWTVTSFVAEQYVSDKIASFALIDAGENVAPDHAARFDSKEYGNSDFHPYLKITYAPLWGVSISVLPSYQSGLPGGTLSYVVTVTNIGTFDDNYDLTANDNEGWTITLSENYLAVPAGENRTATLCVSIPAGTPPSKRDNITVTVTSRSDNAVRASASCMAHRADPKLGFATLYEVEVDVDNTYLHEGSKLIVKFYTWTGDYQAENVVWAGTTPTYVDLHENIRNPAGTVENARLVLTDDMGSIILTLTSFTVRREHLGARVAQIRLMWRGGTPAERSAWGSEVAEIRLRWRNTPT
jgi:hypothetical protein